VYARLLFHTQQDQKKPMKENLQVRIAYVTLTIRIFFSDYLFVYYLLGIFFGRIEG